MNEWVSQQLIQDTGKTPEKNKHPRCSGGVFSKRKCGQLEAMAFFAVAQEQVSSNHHSSSHYFFTFSTCFLAFLAKSSIQHAQIWSVSSSQTEREHAEAPLCRMSVWFSCSLTQLFGLFLCFYSLGFKVISDLGRIFTKKRKSQPSGEAQSNQRCSLCAALGKGLSGPCSSLRMPRHEPARSRHPTRQAAPCTLRPDTHGALRNLFPRLGHRP